MSPSEKLIDEQLLKMHLQKVAHNQTSVDALIELIDRGYLMSEKEFNEHVFRVEAAMLVIRLEWNANR